MKLSIIVPVYNMGAEGKLNYCLDSLLNQTLPASDYEVIAVDDASTDNSPEILRQYAERYPERIQVIYGSVNKRQGGAKNEGLKHAQGEWIGFVDSDDWVSADCYQKLLSKAEETFVKELRKGVESYFPEFRKNAYYLVNTNEEEKRMILLQQKSDVAFYVYYRLLWMWRRIRK
jgi:glycosyltransferase involved in cell wall biosynthesis